MIQEAKSYKEDFFFLIIFFIDFFFLPKKKGDLRVAKQGLNRHVGYSILYAYSFAHLSHRPCR